MEDQTTLTKLEGITIKITPDGMRSFMTISDSFQKTQDLPSTLDAIIHKLEEKGVRFGIKKQVIKTMIEKEIYNRSILVAEGIPPQDGQDAIIEYKFKSENKCNLKEDFEGKVNFRELGLIKIVHKGDVLATKTPPTQGIPGKKVTGEEIPVKNGQDVSIPLGENTYLSPDGLTLFAAVDGYVSWEDDRISVKTTYEVLNDVDMNIGNIHFIGPVKVRGDVKEGFTINAKGDIEIGGVVENATLISEGDIVVAQGIIGKKAKVIANGDLKCKFIQNGNVEVEGNVIVYDAILHSNVKAGKSVFVLGGKKGVIIGGKITAKNEVNAKNIGNMSEVPTEIEVGIDPKVREEIVALEEVLLIEKKQLEEEKLKYNTLLARNEIALAEQSLARQNELTQTIKMTYNNLMQYKKDTAVFNKEGKVSVLNTLWPGVKLTIGTTTILTKIDYRYATFVNIAGNIEQRSYEKPKVRPEELLLPQIIEEEKEK